MGTVSLRNWRVAAFDESMKRDWILSLDSRVREVLGDTVCGGWRSVESGGRQWSIELTRFGRSMLSCIGRRISAIRKLDASNTNATLSSGL